MATVPSQRTWVTGEVVTAAYMNSNIRDAVNFLLSPPICEVYQTVAQSITSTTSVAILFDSEDVDTDNMHSTSANTSRLTCVTPGRYLLWGGVGFAANASGVRGGWYVINGSFVPGGDDVLVSAASAGQTTIPSRTRAVYLNTNDYVELVAYQTTVGSLNTIGGGQSASLFGARWIGTI